MDESGKNYRITVPSDCDALRLDRFLAMMLPQQSRSYLQRLIEDGHVRTSRATVKASARVTAGEEIDIFIPDPEALHIEAEDIPLDILYEDCDILIVNKARGMTVHPAPGHMQGTLVNALLWHCRESLSGINGVLRPGIVHRIDKDTSGVLCVCKNDAAHRAMAAQLAAHDIERIYLGIVHGLVKEERGTIRGNIGRDSRDRKRMAIVKEGGKEAITHYQCMERFKNHSLLRFQLETGRTHQIRVHMAAAGHPLLYDPVYGTLKERGNQTGQMLHAAVLGFMHPTTHAPVRFEADPPQDFSATLMRLRKEVNQHGSQTI